MRNAILAPAQMRALSKCEAIIERGMVSFIEVGTALKQIKDERLYHRDYETFQDYCRDRWGWDRQRAFQLIKAAEVVDNVNRGLQIEPPTNERQARALSSLPEEKQPEAWQEAVEECEERGEPVTAKAVEAVVERYSDQEVGDQPESEEEPDEGAEDFTPMDFSGYMNEALEIAVRMYDPPNSVIVAWMDNKALQFDGAK